MAKEGSSSGQVFVSVGDTIRLRLPYSEVCMHMRVAGKPMNVQVVGERDSSMAQLLNDDGSHFSSPILLGEAGIFTDGDGHHYVPTRAVIAPQAELE